MNGQTIKKYTYFDTEGAVSKQARTSGTPTTTAAGPAGAVASGGRDDAGGAANAGSQAARSKLGETRVSSPPLSTFAARSGHFRRRPSQPSRGAAA